MKISPVALLNSNSVMTALEQPAVASATQEGVVPLPKLQALGLYAERQTLGNPSHVPRIEVLALLSVTPRQWPAL